MNGPASPSKEAPARRPASLDEVETTASIPIPTDPLERIIGQERAVELARVAAFQRRHLLLVGPPGIGKSMTAQALSLHLPRPQQEVRVVHNPELHERPTVEVVAREEVLKERERTRNLEGELIRPQDAPPNIAERLGYRGPRCSFYSTPTDRTCPSCGNLKQFLPSGSSGNPFRDLLGGIQEVMVGGGSGLSDTVRTTRLRDGVEEVVAYERAGEKIRMLDQRML
ncbi:MAG: ATP-binding protein, partial [Thaumarchaeota archaeon]|nr:ATP-binding protein [Nitrososphaerota archaeon]